jgi:hypothetical protein
MSTDSLLHPYCDVSGSCLIWQSTAIGQNRPRCPAYIAQLLDSTTVGRSSIVRVVMFKKWPTVDPNTCVVMKCLHPRCVASDHVQKGLVNPPMGKISR